MGGEMGLMYGRGRQAGVWLVGVVCTLYLLTAAAPARSAPPELLWRGPGVGTDQNSSLARKLNGPSAGAASAVDGHVFILDKNNARVSEFTPWGEFVKAWGWGVRDGGDGLQTCTSASGCLEGTVGDGPGQFDGSVAAGAESIAVDQAGDVWVG